MLNRLERLPRLVVVLPTAASGVDPGEHWQRLPHLAHNLVERGVLGVLTVQTSFTRSNIQSFFGAFLHNLLQHGHMDKAMRSARRDVDDDRRDIGQPLLTLRLRSARLWYVPRFMDESTAEQTWETLCLKIRENRCLPIIGPGIDRRISRFRQELAMTWADRYQYPLAQHDRLNLPPVAQYVASAFSDDVLSEDFKRDLRAFCIKHYSRILKSEDHQLPVDRLTSKIAETVLEKEAMDPHNVLASLKLPVYITANFNNFFQKAILRQSGKVSEEVFTSGLPKESDEKPGPDHPLVYHLFGHLDDIQSLVLKEDDYFNFLIDFWRDRERIPLSIRKALTSSSLLFLGFNLNHWDFRVLFRSLLKSEGRARRQRIMHVAVQVDPDDDHINDPERARDYLEKYFNKFVEGDVNIFWGSAKAFLSELKHRMEL
jgi:hypothetical protein